MAYEPKDGDIAIFKEKDKKNPKGPDWRGRALIDGKEKEIALWIKGDSGTMLAGQIKPKFVPNYKAVQEAVQYASAPQRDDLEDSIPF